MAETHVISALKQRRSYIAGELAKTEKRCEVLRQHIHTLDQAMRLFGYEGDPSEIKPTRPTKWLFRRGELKRMMLDILRTANGPMTNADLAERVIAIKDWDRDDADLHLVVSRKVKDVRKRMKRRDG